MAGEDSVTSEISDDDGEEYNDILLPPTETQVAESNQNSDALDAGVEGNSVRVLRLSVDSNLFQINQTQQVKPCQLNQSLRN